MKCNRGFYELCANSLMPDHELSMPFAFGTAWFQNFITFWAWEEEAADPHSDGRWNNGDWLIDSMNASLQFTDGHAVDLDPPMHYYTIEQGKRHVVTLHLLSTLYIAGRDSDTFGARSKLQGTPLAILNQVTYFNVVCITDALEKISYDISLTRRSRLAHKAKDEHLADARLNHPPCCSPASPNK